MSIRETIEAEVAKLRQRQVDIDSQDTKLASERRTIEARLRDIAHTRAELTTERESIKAELNAAQRALAVLIEHQPAAPEPTDPEPAATPEPADPVAPRTRRYERDVTTSKTRRAKGPLKRITDPDAQLHSPVREDELQWVRDILAEHPNGITQWAIARELESLMDLKPGTAADLASRSLLVLLRAHEVRWTGEERNVSTGSNKSRVFRLATAPERASAGLPVGDEPGAEFEGTTTHPPRTPPAYDGPGKVAIDPSGFEMGKHR